MIGLILAGGKSKRFGQDKALYQLPNSKDSNVELAVKNLQPFCSEIYLSANSKNKAKLEKIFTHNHNLHIILDQKPYNGHGPMSGLYAVTSQFDHEIDILMIAVDYPFLTKKELTKLISAPSYLCSKNQPHYCLAHLKTSRKQVKKILDNNNWQLKKFITAHCTPIIIQDSKNLVNLNYQSEAKNEN